jgi:endonuclease YncB( thermonuclease family)
MVRKVNSGPAPGVILPVVTRRLFLLAAVAAAALYAEDFAGKVVAISDGDTIRVMHNGTPERIRLWGIDCPEMKQPFGTRAKQFTGDLAFGQVVTVKVRDIDRYKRTVAEIILPDGRNLNQENRSRRPGMVVSAVRAPGDGTAGSGAGGQGC